MGNKNNAEAAGASPPPMGDRVQKCMELFMLKLDDVEHMWTIFKRFDARREGLITREVFFQRIVSEERNDFGEAIFGLIDPEDEENIEFGEFVQGVCTFCCLSAPEMLKFAFMVYDKDHSGHMEMEELHHFIKVLHSSNVSNNVQDAMGSLQLDDFGRLTFEGFKVMNKQFPQVMYPVFRMQRSVQRGILGNKWWKKKITELDYWRENRSKERAKEVERLRKQRAKERDKQVRKAMGLRAYYLHPDRRRVFLDTLEGASARATAAEAAPAAPGQEAKAGA